MNSKEVARRFLVYVDFDSLGTQKRPFANPGSVSFSGITEGIALNRLQAALCLEV